MNNVGNVSYYLERYNTDQVCMSILNVPNFAINVDHEIEMQHFTCLNISKTI